MFLLLPAILFILCIGMFRDISVGTDTYEYYRVFNFPDNIELGYQFLTKVVKFFGGSFNSFLAIFFFLSFILKLLSFKLTSNNIILSLLMYSGFWFLVYDMNGIRQGLALGFVGLGLSYLNKGNIKMFYFAIVLAVFNHYSAAVFLPLAIITRNVICSKKIFFIVFFTVLFLATTKIAQPIINLISSFLGSENHFANKASAYSKDDMYNSNILYSFSTAVRVAILFITFFALQKIKLDSRLKNILLWSALINISIYLIFSEFELIATRLSLYYRFSECIFFSFLPAITRYNILKFLIGLLIFGYVVLQIFQTLSPLNNSLEPYNSILFK
ncbi:EpsG family protein [Chryseobacterium oryzae]|uniref:EpsG family protein n=1 Tax=Chryseobacterium oryzae TaxID=2929799 RepID=A0ABY4BDJ2_9FLAO|nr:EpsG family protein [Chryseobacterium oryzae]UOE37218.1 EpsG family protein [Chryseobacterium oryzae]